MLMRSTGLGKTELEGIFVSVEKEGDYLILRVDTTAPVKWKVRAAISFPELIGAVFMVLKSGKAWIFFLTQLFKSKKNLKRPENY